jgi:hypothetical protein
MIGGFGKNGIYSKGRKRAFKRPNSSEKCHIFPANQPKGCQFFSLGIRYFLYTEPSNLSFALDLISTTPMLHDFFGGTG